MELMLAEFADSNRANEDWYYLEFDEETGEWSIEHHWSHVHIGTLKNDSGDKPYSLMEAKKDIPHVYAKAVELFKVRLFDNPSKP